MKLTVLGSGAAVFNPVKEYRYPASHLIEAADSRMLLDAGIGVLPQITKLGLVIGQINTIAISHFHADHCTLQPLLQAYFLEGKLSGKKPSLHLMGPKGIVERAVTGFDQSGFSYKDDFLPNVDISYTEYEDGQEVRLSDSIRLIPYKTKHYALDAYSLRIESGGKAVAYSGDSTVSEGLKKAARQADIFLCEAATSVDQSSDAGHVNPFDAGLIASNAGAKKLVLTHYTGFDANEDVLAAAQSSGFAGPIDIAVDLSSYDV